MIGRKGLGKYETNAVDELGRGSRALAIPMAARSK
jgi:hypothetical protein